MPFKSESYFTAEALRLAKYFISQNDGNEIVLVGKVDSEGLVCDVRRAAMGNSFSVPAAIAAAVPGEVLIHNHPSGNVSPSAADLDVAARAAEKSIGSYIVDNQLLNVFPVVERILPETSEIEPVSLDEVAEIFGKDGRLARSTADFEFRKPQVDMALEAADAINSLKILVAEAGTGTGKSFAYLVPALLYVAKNKGKKAVVSTSTIALQEQLFSKDIPALIKKLDIEDVGTVVMKGRGNYLCKRRYAAFRMNAIQTSIEGISKERDLREAVEEIDSWMNNTADGSRSDMNSAVAADVWSEICADELACEKSKCRFFNSCYFFKARRKANFASLILVNHHLLMADVSMKSGDEEGAGLLPKYDILVIDEAHNIFRSAMSFLGESVSSGTLMKQLNKLYGRSGQGLLTRIYNNNANQTLMQPVEKAINLLSGGFQTKIANSLMPELLSMMGSGSDENLFELDDIGIRTSMMQVLGKIVSFVMEIVDLVFPVVQTLKEKDESIITMRSAVDDMNRSLITDLGASLDKLTAIAEFYSEFCIGKDISQKVFWGEKEGQASSLSLTITPLNIQKILAEDLYAKVPSVIFTSATLTTGRDEHGFDFFYRESGLSLSDREKRSVVLDSCFDYASQVKTFICSDMPSPTDDKELFDARSIMAAKELVKASGGGALVLFTSVQHRRQAQEYFHDLDFEVISQGQMSVSAVMKRFKEDVNATLLANDTFWEGIDMKGKTLRNLVIIKLPFRFPSHPFVKRYVGMLEKETGKGGFAVYTLPNAILKFKQGFGRLIRTKDDIGTVTVLDKRIAQMRYGKDFVRALPPGVGFQAMPSAKIAAQIKEFFASEGNNDIEVF